MYKAGSFLQFATIVSINLGFVAIGYKNAKNNYDWYLSLPPDQQKVIYNNCSEQCIGSSGGAYSAVGHRSFMAYPKLLDGQKPRVSYEESVSKRENKRTASLRFFQTQRHNPDDNFIPPESIICCPT